MAARLRRSTIRLPVADCSILSFQCHDEGTLKMLGSGVKRLDWKVLIGSMLESGQVIDIQLLVDLAATGRGAQKVKLSHRGYDKGLPGFVVAYPTEKKLQASGAPLMRDLLFYWKYQVKPPMGPPGPLEDATYEIKQPGTDDTWWPGWLEREAHDGRFDVVLRMPADRTRYVPLHEFYEKADTMETCDMRLPGFGMRREDGEYLDIRERAPSQAYRTGLKIQRRCLTIRVPKEDPVNGVTLKMLESIRASEAGKSVTSNWARPTPAPTLTKNDAGETIGWKATRPKLPRFSIDKDRKLATLDESWTSQQFEAYVSKKIKYICAPELSKLRKCWEFKVGPNSHKVVLETKNKTSRTITLTVDDELLVEAKPEHLAMLEGESPAVAKAISKFELEFDLKGKIEIEFETFAVNKAGETIEAGGPRLADEPYVHNFSIKVQLEALNLQDLRNAELIFLTGDNFDQITEFAELTQWHGEDSSGHFKCEPKLLENYYLKHLDMRIPWIVDESAAFGIRRIGEDLLEGKLQAAGAGLLTLGQAGTLELHQRATADDGRCCEEGQAGYLATLLNGIFCCGATSAVAAPDDTPVLAPNLDEHLAESPYVVAGHESSQPVG